MQFFDTTTRAGATVLAALRYYQDDGMMGTNAPPELVAEIATCGDTVTPLDSSEIDQLCEAMNSGGGAVADGLAPGWGGGVAKLPRPVPDVVRLDGSEGPAAVVVDALILLDCVDRAECFDGAQSAFFVLDDGREFSFTVEEYAQPPAAEIVPGLVEAMGGKAGLADAARDAIPLPAAADNGAALLAELARGEVTAEGMDALIARARALVDTAGMLATPALDALADYAGNAPSGPVGEGNWTDLETAHFCGAREETANAAGLMRAALVELGLPAPAGVPVCEGCGRDLGEGEHDDDCTVPIFVVTLSVPGIDVTAKSEGQARRYAESDLGDCKGWRAVVTGISDDVGDGSPGDIEGPDVTCTAGKGGIWHCEAEYVVTVRAKDYTAAREAALAELGFERLMPEEEG